MRADRDLITAARLRELVDYDPSSGVMTSRVKRCNAAPAGRVLGCPSPPRGYLTVMIERRVYKLHRLAWLYVHGAWPTGEVDHIDGNTQNNAIANLRDVTKSVNLQNQRAERKNQCGLLGVSRNGSGFGASIKVDGRTLWLGTYPTAAEAHRAYLTAKREMHEGCTL